MEENNKNEIFGNMVENRVEDTNSHTVTISEKTLGHMASAGKWCTFMAVMLYIASALMVIAAIFYMFLGHMMYLPLDSTFTGIFPVVGGIIYLVLAIIYLFPATYLLKTARAMLHASVNLDNETLATALFNNKRYWKFSGILTIVGIVLAIILVIVAFIISFSALGGMPVDSMMY